MIDTRSLAGAVNKYKFVAIGLIVSIHKAVFDVVLGSPFNLWGLPRTENYIKDGFLFFISYGWLYEMNYDEAELLEELDEQLDDYKRATRYRKLTTDEWNELNAQIQHTAEVTDGIKDIWPSGEHYRMNMILRKFGFCPESRQEIMDIAWALLINGYIEN